jgi:N-acetyl-gamma-glutamyl-phosphate reductase
LKDTLVNFSTLEPKEIGKEHPAGAEARPPRTAIVGVSGYAGGELARLLLRHPRFVGAEPTFFGREGESSTFSYLEDIHPSVSLGKEDSFSKVHPFSWERLADAGIEVLFMATPHEQSREWVPEALARGLRVIDLSGAWRLHDATNRTVYKLQDKDPAIAEKLQTEAIYGCPELHRESIKTARLVANPGCYATSIILGLAPLVQADLLDISRGIVCDAKSGVSGAGKAPTSKTHFMYAADNLSAYSVFGHRHTGELLEQLHLSSDQIQFTPHLLPIPRGILSTIYARLKQKVDAAQINAVFRTFYQASPLVRMHTSPRLPQIQYVVRTNFCDIGFELSDDGSRIVIVSCLDNLLKGAAGQAVQNLNLMCGWKEQEGLL